MIEGFEEHTSPLTEYEQTLVPIFVAGLRTKVGPLEAITASRMEKAMNAAGYKTNGPRIRKIINHIRTHGLVERLIATSAGYYVSNDTDELNRYVQGLRGRVSAIDAIRKTLEHQIAKP